ncbi:MAG: hypothetical protein KY456_04335, partial [Chloroflexi bacterium]|nr:hypothetical protein [Chloroflexota bacterium]
APPGPRPRQPPRRAPGPLCVYCAGNPGAFTAGLYTPARAAPGGADGASPSVRAVFGRPSRPAVTRFAAARLESAPARVNLGSVTLERDCRSAARVAAKSRREPTFVRCAEKASQTSSRVNVPDGV